MTFILLNIGLRTTYFCSDFNSSQSLRLGYVCLTWIVFKWHDNVLLGKITVTNTVLFDLCYLKIAVSIGFYFRFITLHHKLSSLRNQLSQNLLNSSPITIVTTYVPLKGNTHTHISYINCQTHLNSTYAVHLFLTSLKREMWRKKENTGDRRSFPISSHFCFCSVSVTSITAVMVRRLTVRLWGSPLCSL